jgi:hypothetical protein
MQKLNSLPFDWLNNRSFGIFVFPTTTLAIAFACLFSSQFTNTAQAQPSADSSAASFTDHLRTDGDLVWRAISDDFSWSSGSPCDPLDCIEEPSSSESKSLCVIKNRWGGTETRAIRPRDEIWIVSARNCCSCCGAEALDVKRLSSGQWQSSSLDVLANCHQTNSALSTLMYVHGNQTDYEYGMSRGIQLYDNFVSRQKEVGPLRVVLWLWKSEKEQKRIYPDFRVKSQRAIEMGEIFKATLERFGDSRMTLIGFSLGAQVIASALDSMEAERGKHACFRADSFMSQGCCASDQYRIALIAPALDPAYACSVADRTVCSTLAARTSVFYNRSDSTIKALRIIVRRECPDKSVTLNSLLEGRRLNLGPVRTIDLTWESGCRHSIVKYSRTPSLCRELSGMIAEVAVHKNGPDQLVLNDRFAVE